MQLINDLNDLPRYAGLLTPEYRQKLISDINVLLIKYMDEQAKAPNPVEEKKDFDLSFNDISPTHKSLIPPAPVFTSAPPAMPPNKPNLMGNLSKPGFPPPPPPPPPPVDGDGMSPNNQIKLKPLF